MNDYELIKNVFICRTSLSTLGDFFDWSPPKFSKYRIPCKLALNFSMCQRL